MGDKSWMLNAQGIRYARKCIDIVKQELGVKLKLSHPDFLQLLREYAELTEATELVDAYNQLISMADAGEVPPGLMAVQPTVDETAHTSDEETLEVQGKTYPKWRDGKAFKGLYRGNPVYR